MSSDIAQVILQGKDNLSPVFKTASQGAVGLGQATDQAAQKAVTASRNAEQGLKRWEDAGRKVGLAIGTLAAVALKANAESEASQARLEASIANTGHTYDEYADAIDAASKKALQLAFDDEDAADAIAKLTDATGDASTAIRDLSLAEDIARARKISLAQASDIVIKAEQGRISSLTRLGIQIDANATKEEAIAALQAKYAGQAEAYAQTNAATYDRLANSLGNYLEEAGSYLAKVQVPLAALAAGASLLGPTVDGIKAIGAAAKETALVTTLMESSLLGPVGLVAGVAALAGGYYLLTRNQDNNASSANALKAAHDGLADTLAHELSALNQLGLGEQAKAANEYFDAFQVKAPIAEERINKITDALNHAYTAMAQGGGDGFLASAFQKGGAYYDEYIDYILTVNGAYADGVVTIDEMTAAQTKLTQGIHATTDEITGVSDELQKVLQMSTDPAYANQAAGLVNGALEIMKRLANDTSYSAEQATADLKALETQATETAVAVEQNTLATGGWIKATIRNNIEHGNEMTALHDLLDAKKEHVLVGQEVIKTLDDEAKAQEALRTSQTESMVDTFAQNKEDAKAAAEHMLELSENIGLGNGRMNILANLTETVADNIGLAAARAKDSLETTFRVIVGNTNGILSTVDSVVKWGDELIGVEGTTGRIDDLLSRGLITQARYGMAQRAYNRILEDQKDIQDDVYSIQANLAPVIADQVRSQERQLNLIRDMEPSAAAAALGWMDAAEAQENLTIQTELGAAANTEWGSASRQAMEDYVQGIVATDPIQTAMLEKQNLIFQDKDGNWHINWDNADEINSAMDNLTQSLNNLVTALEITYSIDINGDGVVGVNEHIKEAQRNLDGLDDNSPKLSVDDSDVLTAHDDITNAHNALNGPGGLNGQSATVNVNANDNPFWTTVHGIPSDLGDSYYDVIPRVWSPNIGPIAAAQGGVAGVDQALASGGIVRGQTTLVGEHGPEIVHLPYGSLVTPNHASRYQMGSGGGPTYNFYGNINVRANNAEQFSRSMRDYTRAGRNS